MGGLGVGSAVQRHVAAPWAAWLSIIPTLMAATDSPDTDSLLAATPILRGQLHHLHATLVHPMNAPSSSSSHWARHSERMDPKKHWSARSNTTTHQRLSANHSNNPIQKALSQTARKHRCASTTTQQRGIRSGRQMLPSFTRTPSHASPPGCEPTPPTSRPRAQTSARPNAHAPAPIDDHQLPCMTCKCGGGVHQRHSAIARCRTIHPGLARRGDRQNEHAWMSSSFLRGSTYKSDISCEPFNQHLTHVPKRQCSQASLLLPHRCPSAPLRRSAPFRARQMPGRPGKVHHEKTIPSLPREQQLVVTHGHRVQPARDTRTTSTRRWSRHFPPTHPRDNLDDRDTTPENSSNSSTTTQTTHRQLFGTHGRTS